jgi:hypothetical protein
MRTGPLKMFSRRRHLSAEALAKEDGDEDCRPGLACPRKLLSGAPPMVSPATLLPGHKNCRTFLQSAFHNPQSKID